MLPSVPYHNERVVRTRADAITWFHALSEKERWAARWTWQHFTLGVHSTQRADSVHAAIKRFLTSSKFLVDLANSLCDYHKDVQLSSALDVVCQAIRTATSTQADMPCIATISDCLTGHALEIVRSQQAQQQAYTIELQCIAPGCPNPAAGVYKVSRQANPNKKHYVTPSATDALHLVEGDFGLPTPLAPQRSLQHLASIVSCTCQFNTCWKLPCRHMLRLYHQFQLTTSPDGIISPRWIKHAPDEVERRQLLRTLPAEVKEKPSRPMNQREMFAFLSAECQPLIEIARQNEQMAIFLKAMDSVKADLNKPAISQEQASSSALIILNPVSQINRPGAPIKHRFMASWELHRS